VTRPRPETRIAGDMRVRLSNPDPIVVDRARRAVVEYVMRNAPQATNDDLRDQITELLLALGLLTPPTSAPRSRR
jgi:hypothetical protein